MMTCVLNASGGRNPVRRMKKMRDHHVWQALDMEKTDPWLEKVSLKDSAEALRGPRTGLDTRWIEARI